MPPSIYHKAAHILFIFHEEFLFIYLKLRGSICILQEVWTAITSGSIGGRQLETNGVYLKTLVIGRELVSMKKGAVKSAEEFQMSELHIHELRAPVALL